MHLTQKINFPRRMELSGDALSYVCRWLAIEHLGRLAESARRHAPAVHAAQDAWLYGALGRYVDSARRLVALGIVPAELSRRMWTQGALAFNKKWRLPMRGEIEGDDAASIARSLGRIARQSGVPRRRPVDPYDGGVPRSVVEMPRFRKNKPRRAAACENIEAQFWCEVDLSVRRMLKKRCNATVVAAYTTVFSFLTGRLPNANVDRVARTMRHVYIPALVAEFPKQEAWIDKAFGRLAAIERQRAP